jgi:hypothetical protein
VSHVIIKLLAAPITIKVLFSSATAVTILSERPKTTC